MPKQKREDELRRMVSRAEAIIRGLSKIRDELQRIRVRWEENPQAVDEMIRINARALADAEQTLAKAKIALTTEKS